MTESTRASDYWALLEEITECRGHLIRLADAIYTLIEAEMRCGADQGSRPRGLRAAETDADAAADEGAADWLAPVIPLRPGGISRGRDRDV